MKIRLLFAGLLILASATSAMAAGPYIGASGGVTFVHDSDVEVSVPSGIGTGDVSYDTGVGFNVVGGYNFDGLRLEGEFGYKNADVDKFSAQGVSVNGGGSEITVMSYMVNGYYDFKTASAVTPFLGVGVGLLNGEFKDDISSDDDTVFGYQLSAGVSFKVNNNVNLDLSYRFQGAASDFEQDGVKISYNSSNILAGVRYTF